MGKKKEQISIKRNILNGLSTSIIVRLVKIFAQVFSN